MTVGEADMPGGDGEPAAQPFGLMFRALKLGAVGAVVNGYHRDTSGIAALDFPTFSHGAYAQDQAPRGRVVDFRVPIEIDSVKIAPGDVIFGDQDGVCVIPQEVEQEVFHKALEKAHGEGLVERALRDGMGAQEAFEKFGLM